MLDTTYPYPGSIYMMDSPGISLYPDYKEAWDSNTFTSWLMFKPNGGLLTGQWVPLRTVDWEWGGAALNSGSSDTPN